MRGRIIIMKWLIFAYLLFQADSKTKRLAEESLKKGDTPLSVLGGKFQLQRMSNHGVAGGLLSQSPEDVRNISAAASAFMGLNFLLAISRKGRVLSKIAWTLLAAGSAGNLYDRFVRGSVTDFLRLGKGFGKLSAAVFNLADTFVVTGGFMLVLSELLGRNPEK